MEHEGTGSLKDREQESSLCFVETREEELKHVALPVDARLELAGGVQTTERQHAHIAGAKHVRTEIVAAAGAGGGNVSKLVGVQLLLKGERAGPGGVIVENLRKHVEQQRAHPAGRRNRHARVSDASRAHAHA